MYRLGYALNVYVFGNQYLWHAASWRCELAYVDVRICSCAQFEVIWYLIFRWSLTLTRLVNVSMTACKLWQAVVRQELLEPVFD